MTARLQIRHATPQRTRLSVPSHKRDELFFGRLGKAISESPGVLRVRSNALTGSLVLEHQAPLDSILSRLKDTPELEISLEPARPHAPLSVRWHGAIGNALERVNQGLLGLSDGELDFAAVAGIALTGLAVLQFRRGVFLPAGLTLAIIAYRVASARAAHHSLAAESDEATAN